MNLFTLCTNHQETQALLDGPGLPCSNPHQLVPQEDNILVTISSVKGLDANVTMAPGGALRGYVLPTVSHQECVMLKAAEDLGFYGAAPFSLLNRNVVDARISFVEEVEKELATLVTDLNTLQSCTLGRVRTQLMGQDLTAGQPARATESAAQWEAIVESTRIEAQELVSTTAGSLQSISCSLHCS